MCSPILLPKPRRPPLDRRRTRLLATRVRFWDARLFCCDDMAAPHRCWCEGELLPPCAASTLPTTLQWHSAHLPPLGVSPSVYHSVSICKKENVLDMTIERSIVREARRLELQPYVGGQSLVGCTLLGVGAMIASVINWPRLYCINLYIFRFFITDPK